MNFSNFPSLLNTIKLHCFNKFRKFSFFLTFNMYLECEVLRILICKSCACTLQIKIDRKLAFSFVVNHNYLKVFCLPTFNSFHFFDIIPVYVFEKQLDLSYLSYVLITQLKISTPTSRLFFDQFCIGYAERHDKSLSWEEVRENKNSDVQTQCKQLLPRISINQSSCLFAEIVSVQIHLSSCGRTQIALINFENFLICRLLD